MEYEQYMSEPSPYRFLIYAFCVLIFLYILIFKIIIAKKHKQEINYPVLLIFALFSMLLPILTELQNRKHEHFQKNKCSAEGVTLGTQTGGGGKGKRSRCLVRMIFSFKVNGTTYRNYECIGSNDIREIGVREKYRVYYDCTHPEVAFMDFTQKIEKRIKFIEDLDTMDYSE